MIYFTPSLFKNGSYLYLAFKLTPEKRYLSQIMNGPVSCFFNLRIEAQFFTLF